MTGGCRVLGVARRYLLLSSGVGFLGVLLWVFPE